MKRAILILTVLALCLLPAAPAESLSAGSILTFGSCEQDDDPSNGPESIEWIVLASDGKTATLISRYGLDTKPYNGSYASVPVTWETCTLRQWLNGDFLNAAFSAEERARLVTATVTADRNPNFDTDPGSDTQDTVFLLSIDEAEAMFSGFDTRKCQATAYAIAQGASASPEGESCWWLRTPGYVSKRAAYVAIDGLVNAMGDYVSTGDTYVVRPAVVVRLS